MIKQHVVSQVAKVLGDCRRRHRRLHAHQRRLIAGGDDDDAAREPARAEVALDKVVHFAAALADQGDRR